MSEPKKLSPATHIAATDSTTQGKLVTGLNPNTVKANDIQAALHVLFPALQPADFTFQQHFESRRLWIRPHPAMDAETQRHYDTLQQKIACMLDNYSNAHTLEQAGRPLYAVRETDRNGIELKGAKPFVVEDIRLLANAINYAANEIDGHNNRQDAASLSARLANIQTTSKTL